MLRFYDLLQPVDLFATLSSTLVDDKREFFFSSSVFLSPAEKSFWHQNICHREISLCVWNLISLKSVGVEYLSGTLR
jgi:hypothetical protein